MAEPEVKAADAVPLALMECEGWYLKNISLKSSSSIDNMNQIMVKSIARMHRLIKSLTGSK